MGIHLIRRHFSAESFFPYTHIHISEMPNNMAYPMYVDFTVVKSYNFLSIWYMVQRKCTVWK